MLSTIKALLTLLPQNQDESWTNYVRRARDNGLITGKEFADLWQAERVAERVKVRVSISKRGH